MHVRRAVSRPSIRFFLHTPPGAPLWLPTAWFRLKTNLSIRFPAIWLVYTKPKSTSFGRWGASVLWLFHGSHIVARTPTPTQPRSQGFSLEGGWGPTHLGRSSKTDNTFQGQHWIIYSCIANHKSCFECYLHSHTCVGCRKSIVHFCFVLLTLLRSISWDIRAPPRGSLILWNHWTDRDPTANLIYHKVTNITYVFFSGFSQSGCVRITKHSC